MRIHRIQIDNFRGLSNFTLSLLDPAGKPRPLTILVGPNGSGKTTTLDALHLAYAMVANFGSPKLRPDFNPDSPTLRRDPNQPITIDIEFSLQQGEWEAINDVEKQLGEKLEVENAPVYSFTFRWPGWPPPDGSSFSKRIPHNSNRAFRGRAYAAMAVSRKVAEPGIFTRIGGVHYLDQHRSVVLGVPSVRTGVEENLREDAGSRDVLPWLELISRLDQKWDPATQGESAWKRVKRLYAALAAPSLIDDIKAMDEGFDIRFVRDGHFYYSDGLSSGEQQVLRLVTNLTAFRAWRSVILIDELELHLHPQWQRDLLHFCRKGGDDSNQFIVTTHSESIVRYASPDEVVSLGGLEPQ